MENGNNIAVVFRKSLPKTFKGFKVINGEIKTGQKVKFMATNMDYHADEIGALRLKQFPKNSLKAGEVGYIISGIKAATEVKVGDTIIHLKNRDTSSALEGFKEVKQMVFCGIFPVDSTDYEFLKDSLARLSPKQNSW